MHIDLKVFECPTCDFKNSRARKFGILGKRNAMQCSRTFTKQNLDCKNLSSNKSAIRHNDANSDNIMYMDNICYVQRVVAMIKQYVQTIHKTQDSCVYDNRNICSTKYGRENQSHSRCLPSQYNVSVLLRSICD